MKIKYNIETAKDGQPTISVIDSAGNNIFLHSRYSPLKEADSLKDKFSPEKYDALIVLGTGLGYHLLPLKDTADGYKKVILIDVIKEIKLEIIKNRDTNFLADNSKIVFLAGKTVSEIETALSAQIDLSEIRGLSVIEHPPSMRAFPDYYPEINLYGQYSYNKQTNEVGTIQFGKTYGRQVGVTVRFNLFNGFNDKREVVNTKIIRENSALEKEKITYQVKSTVLDNYYQYQSILQQLIILDQNILAARKSLDIAKVQYEQGAISGFDFRQTQLSLIRTQNAASILRFTLKSIEIELNRLSGEILKKYVAD